MQFFIFGGLIILIMLVSMIDLPDESPKFSITKIKKQNKQFTFTKNL